MRRVFEMSLKGFSRIIGQERAKEFLKGVLAGGKLPHAYLFTGISGVGKSTAALSLAMILNCRTSPGVDSCGICPACRQIMGGNAPDFITIQPEGRSIKIEQIRELNRAIGFAPVSGRYRVFLIRQAETMTEEAANSFLKSLEEPPPGNLFILNATEPLDLLPTIVSRCQRVPFHPLSPQRITEALVQRMGLEEGKASVLAHLSEGSLGKATKMGQGDFFRKREAWLSVLWKMYALSGIEAMEAVLESVKEGKTGDPEETAESSTIDMLGVWKSWYRDLLVIKVEGSPRLLIHADLSRELKSFESRFTLDQLLESFSLIEKGQRDLRRMRNKLLVAGKTALVLRRLGHSEAGVPNGE
jgi:DNA polymerase III subunit delta'